MSRRVAAASSDSGGMAFVDDDLSLHRASSTPCHRFLRVMFMFVSCRILLAWLDDELFFLVFCRRVI